MRLFDLNRLRILLAGLTLAGIFSLVAAENRLKQAENDYTTAHSAWEAAAATQHPLIHADLTDSPSGLQLKLMQKLASEYQTLCAKTTTPDPALNSPMSLKLYIEAMERVFKQTSVSGKTHIAEIEPPHQKPPLGSLRKLRIQWEGPPETLPDFFSNLFSTSTAAWPESIQIVALPENLPTRRQLADTLTHESTAIPFKLICGGEPVHVQVDWILIWPDDVAMTGLHPDQKTPAHPKNDSINKSVKQTGGAEPGCEASVYPHGSGLDGSLFQAPLIVLDFIQEKTIQLSEAEPMPDGISATWKKKYHFPLADASMAFRDEDADGFSNFEEYQGGTDPTLAVSNPDPMIRLRVTQYRERSLELQFKGAVQDSEGKPLYQIAIGRKTLLARQGDHLDLIRKEILENGWRLIEYQPAVTENWDASLGVMQKQDQSRLLLQSPSDPSTALTLTLGEKTSVTQAEISITGPGFSGRRTRRLGPGYVFHYQKAAYKILEATEQRACIQRIGCEGAFTLMNLDLNTNRHLSIR